MPPKRSISTALSSGSLTRQVDPSAFQGETNVSLSLSLSLFAWGTGRGQASLSTDLSLTQLYIHAGSTASLTI